MFSSVQTQSTRSAQTHQIRRTPLVFMLVLWSGAIELDRTPRDNASSRRQLVAQSHMSKQHPPPLDFGAIAIFTAGDTPTPVLVTV